MTLERLNPTNPVRVIDRTDDSGEAQTRVAVIGERDLFLDVLIEAIQRSGFTAWWADWPGDDPNPCDADLVVLNLDADGYSDRVRRLIRGLAGAELIAVTIDAAAPQPPSRSWTPAGAIWAVDPTVTNIDELACTIDAAAEHRNATVARRRRADRAADAWETTSESSILTMRGWPARADDERDAGGAPSRADGDPATPKDEGDGGRQEW